MKTKAIQAPKGYHWMETSRGPMLMVGDYAPHDGASESYEFQLMEEHEENIEKPEEWDRIYEAIFERTGNKELAAATATARVGKVKDDPKTPAKPSERRSGSETNPEGSASGERGGIKLSEANIKALENLRDEHNEKYTAESKKADLGKLKAVFRRGAGAFSTSHRPSVSSRDQWALGRVKAFLHLLATGRPKNAKYIGDNDLLPEGHPRAGKVEKRLLFVVSTPSDLDIARRRHLCGPSGERFAKSYLEPLGLGRPDVDVVDLGELDEVKDLEPLAVVTLGKTAKELLGDVVDVSLPHPAAIKTDRARDGLGRRLAELGAILEKADSFLPPKGVQEQAEIGLRMREEQPPSNRGGTEVGVARARDLANGRRVSEDTIRRMASFFARHEVDLDSPQNSDPNHPDYPGRGIQAWKLWGGDEGKRFAEKVMRQLEAKEEAEKSRAVGIYKADDEKRIVYGVVLDPTELDAHEDFLSPSVIEETAHDFLESSRTIGLDHNGDAEGATVVESYIERYPSEEDYRLAIDGKPHRSFRTRFGEDFVTSGSWVLGVRLPPELWSKVKDGELNAFSIGGVGTREDLGAGEMPTIEFIERD